MEFKFSFIIRKWVIRFAPLPPYPWEKITPRTYFIGRLVGPRAGLDSVGERKISCARWKFNSGSPGRSQTLYRLNESVRLF
jgi:hypothetical protein